MAVTCRDICELEICRNLKLLGGVRGLNREVTWPYIKSMDTITEWIHGGEMIFVVGNKDDISESGLISLIREAVINNISGVVFLVGGGYISSVPRSVVRVADENEIPVFKMPFNLKLIDVTREISRMILLDKRLNNHNEDWTADTVLELLLKGADKEEVLCHCYKMLQPLLEADRILNTEYVFTLKKYIECNNDLLHTSQKIYIHRNTMINRMKKISALLGKNVNDPEVRNEYQNIFQILEYMGDEAGII